MVKLEGSSMPYTERNIVKQYIDRSSKKCSKRRGYREEYKENT